jgi:DNA polymerase
MRPALIRDIETRSTVDVGDVGAHIYARHPSTEVLCVGYCLDDEPVKIWHPGEPVPKEFKYALKHREYGFAAHGAAFELEIERNILVPRYGFPELPCERNICTMAISHALALPGGLEKIARVLNLDHMKDTIGHRVMLQMSKPRRARKSEDQKQIHWYDDSERMTRLEAYCMDDVEATREILDTLPELSEHEYQVWLLDQKINDRGIYLDEKLLLAGKKIVETALPSFDKELEELTGGEVTAITQRDKLVHWISQYYPIATIRKGDLDEMLLDAGMPPKVRRALELRQQGAHAAIKKIYSLLERRSTDGRVRGAFIYHAAGTGRFSSRGAQVHNLKRSLTEDTESAIKIVMTGDYAKMRKTYPNPLSVIGDLMRATIVAPPGSVLMGADFSGIEARVTAWIADEHKKLDAFRDYDAGKGPDPYIIAAGAVLNIDPLDLAVRYEAGDPIAREQRQIGKACELAFGYQGGVNAFKRFLPSGGGLAVTASQAQWEAGGRSGGGPRGPSGDTKQGRIESDDFTDEQIDAIKNKWRRAHPHIAQLWRNLNQAVWRVILNPGLTVTLLDRLEFEYDQEQQLMWIRLPSGRRLCYPHARKGNFYSPPGSGIVLEGKGRQNIWQDESKIAFKDASSGRWRDVIVYGGLLTENIVQAVARDLLTESMLRLDKAGFDIVAHVHDECIVEIHKRDVKHRLPEFKRLMNQVPAWAEGLPIVAKPWTAERYVK